jgi:PadR family transcriptional regulator, regulatory protein PadR
MARENDPALPQAALELVILRAVAAGPLHGYGIALRIHEASKDLLRVEEGSLYPALHRLEQTGLLRAAWETSETNRRARYYSLTPRGRRRLEEQKQKWARLTEGVARVLSYA